MNKSKYLRNDNEIKKVIDECRRGDFTNLSKLYNTFNYILKGYIEQNNITNKEEKNKIQEYFYDSIKLFARYEYGYNIISYIYQRLSLINKKEVKVNIQKLENDKNSYEEKSNEVVEEYYNKYYYLIKEYVNNYEFYLKQDVVLFAQKLLKDSIEDLLKLNKEITEDEIKKYFNNFDYKFKKNLGNVELVLNDIKDGKNEYINIILDKYKDYIQSIVDNINGNENDKKVFIAYLKRIIDLYNKGVLKTDYSINSYIMENLDEIGKELKYNKNNFEYLIDLIKNGKSEYIYSIYDLYSSYIIKALNNTKYNKNAIKNYIEKTIIDLVNDYINSNQYDIKKFKTNIKRTIESVDRKYYLYINNIPNIKVKKTINDIRKGKYELIEDLVKYYKYKLKEKFEYSNAENDVIDDLLFKLLIVDINKYLFSENYEFSFALDKYIYGKENKYKSALDNYIKSLEDSIVSTEDALILSKKENKFIYVIYRRYEKHIDEFLNKELYLTLNNKYDNMKKNILYNSIKKYILNNDNLNIDDLNKNIYLEFSWLKDSDEDIKTK